MNIEKRTEEVGQSEQAGAEPTANDVFRKAYAFNTAKTERDRFGRLPGLPTDSISKNYEMFDTATKTHTGFLNRLRQIADGKLEPNEEETKLWRQEEGRSLKQLLPQEWADREIAREEAYLEQIKVNRDALNRAMSKAKIPGYVREGDRYVYRGEQVPAPKTSKEIFAAKKAEAISATPTAQAVTKTQAPPRARSCKDAGNKARGEIRD